MCTISNVKILTFANVKVYINTEDVFKKNVVYKLTFPNNKIYIGQTIQKLKNRLSYHCTKSFKFKDDSIKARAIRKYLSFKVDILYEGEDLNNKEMEYISLYNSCNRKFGYNLESGGCLNKILSNETKKKLSTAMKGNRNSTKKVLIINILTKEEKEFQSLKDAGIFYDVNSRCISEVLNGQHKTFKKKQYTAKLITKTK